MLVAFTFAGHNALFGCESWFVHRDQLVKLMQTEKPRNAAALMKLIGREVQLDKLLGRNDLFQFLY